MLKLARELLKNLLRRPVTIEYGVKAKPNPTKRYRGLHIVNPDKCISCSLCAIECPTGAIKMTEITYGGKKKKIPVIDYGLCVFCYHCVDICPRKAYNISNEIPPPVFKRALLRGDPREPKPWRTEEV